MIDKNETSATGDTNRRKIVIERTYTAAVKELWELWTTKEGFESWWGPEGFRAEVRALDARQDGTLHYDMIADSPEMVAAMKQMGRPASHEGRATFTVFAPHDRLSITSLIDFLPGVKPYESTIKVEFFPSGTTVRMVVTLDPMHNEEFTQMQKEGFASQLSKLDKRYDWVQV
ncbi:SRPBCC family protein [Schlesneria paludicola]|uniref:SRPBCC family protein n=1 Tax=Schlesneria paludicola TaxID=360056 RepID=UPI00029B041C|nr:SRPBCC domain-containing protein [Schlesneria paludicola]